MREELEREKEILVSEAKKRIYEGNFLNTGLLPLIKMANLTESERISIYRNWWNMNNKTIINLYGEAILNNNLLVIEIMDYYYINGNDNRAKVR